MEEFFFVNDRFFIFCLSMSKRQLLLELSAPAYEVECTLHFLPFYLYLFYDRAVGPA